MPGWLGWLRGRLGGGDDRERGSSLVEFVFIAIVVIAPLLYVVAGFSAVQRGVFASTAAAREAGRVLGSAVDLAAGLPMADRAVQLAISDQSIDATDVQLQFAPAGSGCDAAGSYMPTLEPGEVFVVCVTVTVRIPLLPEFIDANTATGQFVVHRDRYIDP